MSLASRLLEVVNVWKAKDLNPKYNLVVVADRMTGQTNSYEYYVSKDKKDRYDHVAGPFETSDKAAEYYGKNKDAIDQMGTSYNYND